MKEIVTYHDNGVVKERYQVDETGRKQGLYEKFFETGQIEKECYYTNGKRYGNYTEWYISGRIKSIKNYIDGKKEGRDIIFYKNGVKQAEYTFKENKIYEYKRYKETGQLYEFVTYSYNDIGKLLSKTSIYYNDEGIQIEKYITNKHTSIEYTLHEKFYPTGQKKLECTYINGVLDGKYNEWYPSGNKWIMCTYKAGVMVGEYISYHENGNIKIIYNNDKNGLKTGLYKEFYENGQKAKEFTYKDDILNGIYRKWNIKGKLEEIKLYLNNGVAINSVFVVGNTTFSADEYIQAYNSGSEEFKVMEVVGFKSVYEAREYLNSLKNEKSKDKLLQNIDR